MGRARLRESGTAKDAQPDCYCAAACSSEPNATNAGEKTNVGFGSAADAAWCSIWIWSCPSAHSEICRGSYCNGRTVSFGCPR